MICRPGVFGSSSMNVNLADFGCGK